MVSNRCGKTLAEIAFWAVLIGVVTVSFFPAVWLLLTSLKEGKELFQYPITYLPKIISFQNYIDVFQKNPFGIYMANSVVVTAISTAIVVLVSTMAAYALCRLNLPFREWILGGILVFSMLPLVSIILSIFLVTRELGWLNTYQGLIGPYVTFQLPLAIFILNNFFAQIPRELEEAAFIDGATPQETLMKIVAPLSAPGMVSAAILVAIMNWNDFIIAAALTTNQEMRTIPVGIVLYPGEFAFPWGTISAASTLAVLPITFFILFAQKWIIRGLTAGSIKG